MASVYLFTLKSEKLRVNQTKYHTTPLFFFFGRLKGKSRRSRYPTAMRTRRPPTLLRTLRPPTTLPHKVTHYVIAAQVYTAV